MKNKMKFYCVVGRHSIKTSEYSRVKLKNGRKAIKARCPDHGNVMYRITGK